MYKLVYSKIKSKYSKMSVIYCNNMQTSQTVEIWDKNIGKVIVIKFPLFYNCENLESLDIFVIE